MKIKFQSLLLALAYLACMNQAAAQSTTFTYQGRVTDNGTNFTGLGQFQFALVTSTNASHTAKATANAPSGGYITGYNLISAGNGYSGSTAAVTLSGGGGSGAAAHANISGGMVASITVDNPGNGLYTSAPTVMIAAPPANITYTTYWSNDGTSVAGSEPSAAASVPVNSGLFTVVLGDPTLPNMAAINASLFSQPNLQLRIWFSDGANGFAALDPVQNLTPTPYAITAANLSGVVENNFIDAGVLLPTISGGSGNSISPGADYSTIGGGLNNEELSTITTIGGGGGNIARADAATVGGGNNNTAGGTNATVGGGGFNVASGQYATVSGGKANTASSPYTTISGGFQNTAIGSGATVCGGEFNAALGASAFAAGFSAEALHDGAFVWADSQNAAFSSTRSNQFSIRAGGGVVMNVSGSAGLNPAAVAINSTSGNGVGLVVNESSSDTAALFANGGTGDIIKGFSGGGNTVFEVSNSGGVTCQSVGINTTSPQQALSVVGGMNIDQGGQNSGNVSANALTFGSGSGEGIASQRTGSGNRDDLVLYTDFLPRLTIFQNGNIGIDNPFGAHLVSVGPGLTPAYCDGTTWVNASDRNSKEDFTVINPREVLEKISALPVTEWRYKAEADGTKHIGPMAQDFHAAFGLNGADDTHISTVDEGGVALAAIQGLNQKLQEELKQQNTENAELKQQNDSLAQRLNALEQTVQSLTEKK